MFNIDPSKTIVDQQCSNCTYKFRRMPPLNSHLRYTRGHTREDMCHQAEVWELWDRDITGVPSVHYLLPGLMECLKVMSERDTVPWGKPSQDLGGVPLRFPVMDPLSILMTLGGLHGKCVCCNLTVGNHLVPPPWPENTIFPTIHIPKRLITTDIHRESSVLLALAV